MSFSEDQELVLTILKEWLGEKDASFLAKENMVVYWGNPTGDIQVQDWIKLKASEAANIVKATRVPVGIMKYCTEDMLKAACQEEGRTYIAGVDCRGEVKKEFFNFRRFSGPRSETPHHVIAVHLIAELHALGKNILWRDVTYLYEQALKYLKLDIPAARNRNVFLRYAIAKTDFRERKNTKDFNGRYVQRRNGKCVQFTCIKLDYVSGVKEDWTRPEMRELILKAIDGIKK